MGWRDAVYRLLPKPRMASTNLPSRPAMRRLLVVTRHAGDNPTHAYYFAERLKRESCPIELRDQRQTLRDLDPDGLFVVVCRYAGMGQAMWLYANRHRLAGACLFLDDDLAASVSEVNGDWSHLWRVLRTGLLPLPLLNRVLTGIWASTPALANALEASGAQATLVEPFPPAEMFAPANIETEKDDEIRLIFHATVAHRAEHEFLVPVVRQVLERKPNVHFEVVVTQAAEPIWRRAGIADRRITIMRNTDWLTYLDYSRAHRADLLLAPLLAGRANDCRAGTKRFDAMRIGAAAVMSRCPAYLRNAADGEALIDNDPAQWIDTICMLAGDDAHRAAAREATARAVRSMIETGTRELPIRHPCDQPGRLAS